MLGVLEGQLEELPGFFSTISEEKSLHRYAADKWSIRQVLNHLNDTERLFAFRALWFARGFDSSAEFRSERGCLRRRSQPGFMDCAR